MTLSSTMRRMVAAGAVLATVGAALIGAQPAGAVAPTPDDVAPVRSITSLYQTWGIAVHDGKLYTVTGPDSIAEYSLDFTSGTPAPLRTLTGLATPYDIDFDPSGAMYILELAGGVAGVISEIDPDWSGGVNRIKTLAGANTGMIQTTGFTFDSNGLMYTANMGVGSITVFPANWAGGDVAPLRTITGANTGLIGYDGPINVAIAPSGQIYAATSASGIVKFAANADGNAVPLDVITGANTGFNQSMGVAFDSAGKLYVANGGDNTVRVFAADAAGNASPIRIIGGANTLLNVPYGLAFETDGSLLVSNAVIANSAIREFAPPTSPPSAPRSLSAKAGDTFVDLTFRPSTQEGSKPITRYVVTANTGQTCRVQAPFTKYGCRITGLTNGTTYTFTAVARSADGTSVASNVAQAKPAPPMPTAVPGVPTIVKVQTVKGGIKVTVSAPPNSAKSYIQGYRIRNRSSGIGCRIDVPALSCIVTGLKKGERYNFVARAFNALGSGDDTAESQRVVAG